MGQRKRKKSGIRRALDVLLIFVFVFIAAGSGIYFARVFTRPYSNYIANFDEDTLDEVEISKEKCNILVLGTDKSGELTDVIMLAQINPEKRTACVMSIPRDTRVKFNGRWMKINAVHAEGFKQNKGSENAIIAVKELTGIPINHFIKVNFNAFRDSIDELGGVDFNVPQRMKYSDPYQDLYIDLQKGMQHLDGDKSEQLVRFRRYKNGDIDRIKVQQDFLHALIEQQLKVSNIGKISKIYRIIARNMETSMTPDDAVQGARQILSIGGDNITTVTMPNNPQYINEISYVIPDMAGLKSVREEFFDCHDEESSQ